MDPVISVTTNMPSDPTRKARTAMRKAFRATAERHWQRNIPKHFEPGAASRYGYRRRSSKWQRVKQRLGASSQPLLFTGRMRSEVTTQARIAVTATRGATLKLKASLPGFSGRFRLKAGQTRLTEHQEQIQHRIAEVRAMTADEVDDLARFCERTYADEINAANPPRRIV